jgi:hypothetical protein
MLTIAQLAKIGPIWDRCYDFKIFSPKNSAKNLAFFTKNKAELCKILIITLVFEKNAIFFAENWQKSQKIVIITSTPGHPVVYFVSDRGAVELVAVHFFRNVYVVMAVVKALAVLHAPVALLLRQ